MSVCPSVSLSMPLSACLSVVRQTGTQFWVGQQVNQSGSQTDCQWLADWHSVHQLVTSKICSLQCNVKHFQLNMLPTVSWINDIIVKIELPSSYLLYSFCFLQLYFLKTFSNPYLSIRISITTWAVHQSDILDNHFQVRSSVPRLSKGCIVSWDKYLFFSPCFVGHKQHIKLDFFLFSQYSVVFSL